VKKQRRHLELAQPPVITDPVRALHAVSDSKPDGAVAAQHGWPARFTVIFSEQPARFLAQFLGCAANRSKKDRDPGFLLRKWKASKITPAQRSGAVSPIIAAITNGQL